VYGIPAIAVAVLMIGGEFDLSAGVAVTSSALVASMFSYQFTANMWLGVGVSLVVALGIGFVNGYLVVRTGIPSFLVTLGTFFMLRGLNLALTKQVTGNVATNDVSNIDGFGSAHNVFASQFTVSGVTIKITLLWWLVFIAVATWLLLRTRVGNWIFAVGGSAPSSRAVGVPVNRVKIGMFMGVAFVCWFTGMHTLFAFYTVQSGLGVGNEFIYIVAAVVGGCLLTGGYGSAIGAAIGAFSAITFTWHVAVAIGIAVWFGVALALMGADVATRGIDTEALKARFYPQATIDTAKETIEWAKARIPRGPAS
jgi:simple sugar transport system permease protein